MITSHDLPPLANDLPPVEEIIDRMRVVELPMAVRFRGITTREAALIEGPAGWAEFSPFLEYGPEEASRWLACTVEAGWQGLPDPVRNSVPVNATMPAVDAAAVADGAVEEILARYDSDGLPGTVKIKVAERGQTMADDVARVARVRALLPHARIRVDANQGWTHDQALAALEELGPFDLEYAEQPVPGIEGLARLREALSARGLPVRIAADEAVRKETDPLAVARAGAADLIVVKAQPLGGPRRALAIVEQAGLDAVVSSALDTSVGLRIGAGLAAALPSLPFACGLGTGSLFVKDVADPPYVARNGALDLCTVDPDPERLEALGVPTARRTWWEDRLRDSYRVLAAAKN
ncbi:MAG: o-succinylbenzoate synthase [Galactobacter sp.]